jgi:hypothetical protein
VSDNQNRLAARESGAARRLGRLFRFERVGAFDRRPIETVRRLIARRGRALEELVRLDAERRSLAMPPSPELGAALAELAREVDRSRGSCLGRIDALADVLRPRQRVGAATGLRGSADGRLLGRG